MGQGNYIARVQACVPGLIDSSDVAAVAGSTKEKCKLYPGPDGVAGTADDTSRTSNPAATRRCASRHPVGPAA